MIKKSEIKVGLLVWLDSHWDCPGVVIYVTKNKRKFKVRTFDFFDETELVTLDDNPKKGITIHRDYMRKSSIEEVKEYFRRKETSFADQITVHEEAMGQVIKDRESYSSKVKKFLSEYRAQDDKNRSRVNLDELRKAAEAVYLATDEKVANNLSALLSKAAEEIEYLRKKP